MSRALRADYLSAATLSMLTRAHYCVPCLADKKCKTVEKINKTGTVFFLDSPCFILIEANFESYEIPFVTATPITATK